MLLGGHTHTPALIFLLAPEGLILILFTVSILIHHLVPLLTIPSSQVPFSSFTLPDLIFSLHSLCFMCTLFFSHYLFLCLLSYIMSPSFSFFIVFAHTSLAATYTTLVTPLTDTEIMHVVVMLSVIILMNDSID